jgi:predicted alpha/beta-hydrolase family hydrolase
MSLLESELPEEGAPVAHILLTHGASQPMGSRFFTTMVPMLLARQIAVTRFEFAYMQQIRETGKRRPPPRIEKMFPELVAALDEFRDTVSKGAKTLIGGKSMGGRICSMLADGFYDNGKIDGLVCLGYPFHPPKKPESLRTSHLEDLKTPALFAQGDRDPFGTKDDVAGYRLSDQIRFHWVDDGDHDFGPRGKSGFTRKGNIEAAAQAIRDFADHL